MWKWQKCSDLLVRNPSLPAQRTCNWALCRELSQVVLNSPVLWWEVSVGYWPTLPSIHPSPCGMAVAFAALWYTCGDSCEAVTTAWAGLRYNHMYRLPNTQKWPPVPQAAARPLVTNLPQVTYSPLPLLLLALTFLKGTSTSSRGPYRNQTNSFVQFSLCGLNCNSICLHLHS